MNFPQYGATQGELRYDPISTDGPEAIAAFGSSSKIYSPDLRGLFCRKGAEETETQRDYFTTKTQSSRCSEIEWIDCLATVE